MVLADQPPARPCCDLRAQTHSHEGYQPLGPAVSGRHARSPHPGRRRSPSTAPTTLCSERGGRRRPQSRLDAARTWIVDPARRHAGLPLQPTAPSGPSTWHWSSGGCTTAAGAVSVPGMHRLYGTDLSSGAGTRRRSARAPSWCRARAPTRTTQPMSPTRWELRLTACGSAGVKAMLVVVGGEADVYVHASGLYEWDACAPGSGGRCSRHGAFSDLEGDPIDLQQGAPRRSRSRHQPSRVR